MNGADFLSDLEQLAPADINLFSNDPARPDEGKYNSYKISLSYIEIPLLFQYNLHKWEFEIGPGIGVLLTRPAFAAIIEVLNKKEE